MVGPFTAVLSAAGLRRHDGVDDDTDEEDEGAEVQDEPSSPDAATPSHRADESASEEKDFKPVYLKGLFRCATMFFQQLWL